MSIDYLAILPQIIMIVAGLIILLLEPFTAPERKGRLGQIARDHMRTHSGDLCAPQTCLTTRCCLASH